MGIGMRVIKKPVKISLAHAIDTLTTYAQTLVFIMDDRRCAALG